MDKVVNISLCMGSSCFARGNSLLLDKLEDAIERNGWKERVALSGTRCAGKCGQGPNVVVDGELHHGMDQGTLLDLLRGKLETQNAQPT